MTSQTYTIAEPGITADVELTNLNTLDTVEIGDPINAAHMTALKNYINTLCTAWGVGSSYTIATVNAGTIFYATDWNSYITKANTLPHVSGLTAPSQNNPANASYYNSIVNAVCPSN